MTIIPKYKSIRNDNFKEAWLDQVARFILFKKLDAIKHGYLQVYFNGLVYEFGDKEIQKDLHAVIYVHDAKIFREIILGGEPAAGNGYVQGGWSAENLIEVIRLFTLNREVLFSFKYGLGSLAKHLYGFTHRNRKNSKQGSKRNIQAHYDIGNDFYRLFLDKYMMYSSACFASPQDDLEKASENKLKKICEKLALTDKDHVLEIGSGWGGFAIYAARHYGCQITTTTISQEQYEYVKQQVESKRLSANITLLKEDYRNLEGSFDKIVSIEMIESVGHQYLDEYFSICNRLLKTTGVMLIQAITISDYLYHNYLHSMDFIRKYVFPGGSLPSVTSMLSSITNCTDMTLFHSESYASSYAKTLEIWHQRFISNKEKVTELGYTSSFLRLWEYYLKYCQAGFEERVIDVHQLVLKKPDNRFHVCGASIS